MCSHPYPVALAASYSRGRAALGTEREPVRHPLPGGVPCRLAHLRRGRVAVWVTPWA